MTKEELKKIVFDCVAEHGNAKARRMLLDRCSDDSDFMMAAALHGADIFRAMYEAETATQH